MNSYDWLFAWYWTHLVIAMQFAEIQYGVVPDCFQHLNFAKGNTLLAYDRLVQKTDLPDFGPQRSDFCITLRL
jgi:hypothetical protein